MSEHRVLLVDDEENVLRALKRLLRKEPYELVTALSGEEALEKLAQEPVHLVISDQRMPGMSGTELLGQVKERSPDTVRVILSGYADMSVVVDSINQGEVYRLLAKPWNDDELKTVIRQCLEQYDMRAQNRELLEKTRAQNEELQRLNERLEEMVAERTQTLRLSQEILEELPAAIVGISREHEIVLTNETARQAFPPLQAAFPGTDMEEVLPDAIVPTVTACLDGTPAPESLVFDWDDTKVRVGVQRLGKQDVRGCILILEAES